MGSKRPILRFVLVLGTLMVLFNVFFYVRLSEDSAFGSYLHVNAKLSAAFINTLGNDATVAGTWIHSPRFSVEIRPGCDGVQASAFFVFALLASPSGVSLLRRIPAMLAGAALLLSMNIVRIVSLYYVGIYFPNAFEALHIEVWQAVFIFVPILLWVIWERIAAKAKAVGVNVGT